MHGCQKPLLKYLVGNLICNSWTPTAKSERWIQAFKHKNYRKILLINYEDYKTNAYVRDKRKILM
jgi:hypothetical protein